MALALLQNITAISKNNRTIFQGTGGVEPYSYSVLPGGAGGSIDPVTGVYTSPDAFGIDTIEVTDSDLVPATAQATINVLSAIQLFCDVIRTELELDADQVYIYNQKFDIPVDDRLYIAVGVLVPKPFSNTNRFLSDTNEKQSANFQCMMSVNILSKSMEALHRKEEVIMALNSTYAQSQMEANSFYIAPLSTSFVNLSEMDGPAIPFRFNISVNMQYFVTKSKSVPYYNDFEDAVVTED